jgi:hypothetical protein
MNEKKDIFENQTAYESEVLKRVSKALSGIKYGAVVITVHNGKVVQLERTEKTRYDDDQYVVRGGGI